MIRWNAVLSLISTIGLVTLVCSPTDNEQRPEPKSFKFSVQSKPLAGYENVIDAVTKIEGIPDTLFVAIDSITPPDSLDSLVVDWGDGSVRMKMTGRSILPGVVPNALIHSYLRPTADTAGYICTTSCYALTRDGAKRDTNFIVRVLAQRPEPKSFKFSVQSNPVTGFENVVDAVTKATNKIDSLIAMVDSIAPSDSLDSLVIDWGDGTVRKVLATNRVQLGGLPNAITHWYVRPTADSVSFVCTTSCFALTHGGARKDTSFLVRVIPAIP